MIKTFTFHGFRVQGYMVKEKTPAQKQVGILSINSMFHVFTIWGQPPPNILSIKRCYITPPPHRCMDFPPFLGGLYNMPTSLPKKKNRSFSPNKPNHFCNPQDRPAPLTGSWPEPMELWTWFLSFCSRQKAGFFQAWKPLDLLSVESDQALVIHKANRKQQILLGKAGGLNQHWSDERNPLVMREKLVLKPLDGEKKQRESEVMSWWKWEIQC